MKKNSIILAVGIVAIVAASAWYLNSAGNKPAAQAGGRGGAGQGPTTVNVVAATRQDVPVVLQANGTVTPLSTVDLRPQTTSTIRKVHIKEGQFVSAGQLLFTLDDRSDRANLDKARAELARNQAALAESERQYKRSQELHAQQFIAQSALDTLRSQVEAARALVAANQAAVQAEQVNTSYTAIKSPMAGRVGAINVYPGSLVQPATSLATITQIHPISVAFNLPEAALADLLAAQRKGPVAVQAGGSGSIPALSGRLSFIDNTVDPTSGMIRVKAEFDNRDTALWPGQYVTARLTVNTLRDAVVVPQAAIVTTQKGSLVYVVDSGKTARQVPVQRLHAFGTQAVISGLAGGEQVVTEGKQNLRPGGKVRLAQEGAKGGAPKADPKGGPDGAGAGDTATAAASPASASAASASAASASASAPLTRVAAK
jgi:RND family efflux transporter MFP subunit